VTSAVVMTLILWAATPPALAITAGRRRLPARARDRTRRHAGVR
jgi:hypothetical protein